MRITALDLSLTATGVARYERGGPPRLSVLSPPGLTGMPRLEWIAREVVTLTQGSDLVVIEGYAFARVNQAHQLGELGGVVRLSLYLRRMPVVEIAPPALKKYATGKGNAKKEAVLTEAVRRLGYKRSDTNEADALWLLAMALDHYGLPGAPEMPKASRSAVERIAWPEITHAKESAA